ncbi:MAG: hypothetical protein ACYC3X_06635 [Pirellulaceae bacterium]
MHLSYVLVLVLVIVIESLPPSLARWHTPTGEMAERGKGRDYEHEHEHDGKHEHDGRHEDEEE